MIDWHKRQVEFWKSKLGISEYGMLWIAFIKGVIFPDSSPLCDNCLKGNGNKKLLNWLSV